MSANSVNTETLMNKIREEHTKISIDFKHKFIGMLIGKDGAKQLMNKT